jgi:two-component system cell cycle sensor histidine kinase/response regulator CckA
MKILLVEDCPEYARFVRALLTAALTCDVEEVTSLRGAIEALARGGTDVVLLDLSLPDSDGLDTLDRVLEASTEHPPIVVLTATADDQLALKAIHRGAQDYLLKSSIDADLLARALRYAIERRQSAEALRDAVERYRCFFEEDLTGDFLTTPAGEIHACNSAFARIFGYDSVDEANQHSFLSLFPTPEAAEQLIARVRAHGRLEHHEQVYRRRDGKPAHVIQNVVGVFGPQGELRELRGYVFDITAQKQVEEQLRQAQKIEAIGRLAGGVAHDFNNLLTVITGYGDRIIERLDERDPLRKGLDAIKKAADRAASLTEQLLAFSRQQVLAPKVLDLNAVVMNMDKLLRRVIGEDIELRTMLGRTLGRIKADQSRIEQVLMNLAVNARDAMPQGGALTIETANVDLDESWVARFVWVKPGPYVMITVSDTGCGMDAETRARLFEPFFTTKAQGKGTGLGLSTAYGIVKQSGGYIWVESQRDQGATFRICLPRVDEAIEQTLTERAIRRVPRGTETILLVEDEDDVRHLLREVLDSFGYTVLEACNGLEAIAVAEAQTGVDLLLTDVVMPLMSGRDLAHRLLQRRGELKILYMSGYTDDTIIQHGGLEPGTAFLQKPFSPSVLARKVREVLDSSPIEVV